MAKSDAKSTERAKGDEQPTAKEQAVYKRDHEIRYRCVACPKTDLVELPGGDFKCPSCGHLYTPAPQLIDRQAGFVVTGRLVRKK